MYHGLRGGALTERAAALLASVRIPSPGGAAAGLPPPALGRHAPARGRRHGHRRRRRGCSSPTSRPPASTSPSRPSISACLKELQERHRLAMIFVTHNLGIVARIVRPGRRDVCGPHRRDRARCAGSSPRPRIPTRRPCSSRSRASAPGATRLTAIEGQPPDLATLPAGCAFAPRCPHVMDRCSRRGAARVRAVGARAYDPLLAARPGA